MNNRINFIAVGLGGILYWLLQAGWYTFFSRQWITGTEKTVEQLSRRNYSTLPLYIVAFANSRPSE